MLQKLLYFADWLLPRICVCCGFASGDLNRDLCVNCKANLPWLDYRCYQCGSPVVTASEAIICEACNSSPPPFSRLCALFKYQQPIIKLIGSLKFGRQLYPGALLGQLLAEAITEQWYVNKNLPQVIIPVPLHIKRHVLRGYNQATELSRPIAKLLNIPLDVQLCIRNRHTQAQAKLNKNKRSRNLTTAFTVKMPINYQHVALIDDVVTTGSTVRAISVALRNAGVEHIDIWCVCRA